MALVENIKVTADKVEYTSVSAGARTVEAKLRDFVTVEEFGAAGDGVTDDTAAIRSAIAYCAGRGIPVKLLAKPYVYSGGTIPESVTLIGESVPSYNAVTNSMTGGTRIIGGMRFSGNQVTVENMGFVRPTGSAGDCLVLSTNNAAGASARVRNVVGAGTTSTAAFHCLLVEGYDSAHVSGVTAAYNLFGIALKSRNVVANDLLTHSCDTGVIVKADSEFSTAKSVSINGHVNVGNGVCSQGLWVLATTAQLERVVASNLVSTGTAINCRISATNTVNDVIISNAVYEGSTYSDFFIDGGSSTHLYNVSLSNISCTNSVKLASVGWCEQLNVNGFYGSLSLGANPNGAFEVSSGTGLFIGTGMHLVSTYGTSLAELSLGNSYEFNKLAAVRAKVTGTGKPRPGYFETAIGGTNLALTVGDSLYGNGVLNIISASAGTTVSSINVNDTLGQPVSPGFMLSIRNASPNAVTLNHNPGVGGIANNGAATKVLAGGDVIQYFFDGSNWRQVPSIV